MLKTHKFLTTKPSRRLYITTLQCEMLYVLALSNNLFSLSVKIFYSDNTSHVHLIDISGFKKSQVFQVSLSWSVINGIFPTKSIKYFQVYIDKLEDLLIYYPRGSKTDKPTEKLFYYKNSLGGFDSLVCEGDHGMILQSQEIISNKELSLNYPPDESEYLVGSTQSNEILNANTGYKPKTEILALADMFHNNQLYEVKYAENSSFLFPARIVTKNPTFPSQWSNLKSLSFLYRYNYDNRALNRIS